MWQQLIVWVALQAIAYLLRPKPETQKPPAAQQVKGPKIDIGNEIPVLFGTRDITERSQECLANMPERKKYLIYPLQ